MSVLRALRTERALCLVFSVCSSAAWAQEEEAAQERGSTQEAGQESKPVGEEAEPAQDEAAVAPAATRRPRLRELGLSIGSYPIGEHDAITDVPGVRVGHCTLLEDGRLATGVTAILPHSGNLVREKVRAAVFTGNGFGKLVGTTQIAELGTLETPVLLTGTLSTFRVADAVVSYALSVPGNEDLRSVSPTVGETNDGSLSDVRARPITEEHVLTAIRGASGGTVAMGSVGAGTGTRCLGFKGGIGSASRRVVLGDDPAVVGVLVQSNFGGDLRVLGAPIGAALRDPAVPNAAADRRSEAAVPPDRDGSCMIVVATDAPLDARQLGRLARRAVYAMARVGASYANGSGDYAIAFSTELATSEARVADEALSPLFEATLDAVEEALLDSLLQATEVLGLDGRRATALPIERFVTECAAHGLPAHLPASGPGDGAPPADGDSR